MRSLQWLRPRQACLLRAVQIRRHRASGVPQLRATSRLLNPYPHLRYNTSPTFCMRNVSLGIRCLQVPFGPHDQRATPYLLRHAQTPPGGGGAKRRRKGRKDGGRPWRSRRPRATGTCKPCWGNHSWAPGYCVDTVGLNEEMIGKYVEFQEKKERHKEPPELQY